MKCYIGDATFRFDPCQVDRYDNLVMLKLGCQEFFIFEDTEAAGDRAREYWEELAIEDADLFLSLVGAKNVLTWALGGCAGPDYRQVNSLEDWLDLWLHRPEEHWGKYDDQESLILFSHDNHTGMNEDGAKKQLTDDDLKELFGFVPTVAYRHR